MDKKIGKLSFLFICVGFIFQVFAQAPHLQLSIKDINGDQLSKPAVGIPFFIELQIDTLEKNVQITGFPGLEQFVVDDPPQMSSISRMINGVTSGQKIYRYTARAEKVGSFTLGPVTVQVNNQNVHSNSLSVTVAQEQKNGADQSVFFRMAVDKKQPVVGESVLFVMRFYGDPSIKVDGIGKPDLSAFSAQELSGPFQGSKTVNGKEFAYIEWRTNFYPTKPGTFVIPAVSAVYSEARKSRRQSAFTVINLFDRALQQKQVFSNAVSITVDPLPLHDGPVHAVGTLTKVRAEVDRAQAPVGDGIVYKLTVFGDTDFQSMDAPELKMPETLRYYESKSYLPDKGPVHQQKVFEYIIQATEPGAITIPAQVLTFFDLKTKTYKTISTKPIKLDIRQSHKIVPSDLFAKEEQEDEMVEPEANGIIQHGQWQRSQRRSIPLMLYVILLMMPLFVIGGIWFYRVASVWRAKTKPVKQKKNAFKHARKKLSEARTMQAGEKLYETMTTFFAHWFSVLPHEVSEEAIEELVEKAGPEKLGAWTDFFNRISYVRYGAGDMLPDELNSLFDEAGSWITFFEDMT